MLHDVLPLVTTLHIEKASQPRVGAVSKHLRDVRSITIYNLFSLPITGDIELNEDIATKSVQFIIASKFPHLESVAFWGKSEDRLHSLNMSFTSIHNNQRGSIYSLMDELSGAFDCGSLPHNLQMNGLRCPRKNSNYCTVCKRVCNDFPLELTGDVDLCLPYAISNEIIESREGGRDYLHSETRFMQLLDRGRVKVLRDDCCVIKYSSWVKDELTSFVESTQMDVVTLNPENVVNAIKKQYPDNITVYLSEESFDHLKTAVGLPINNELLDPTAIRLENLERMVKHIMEETDSLQKSVNQMYSLLAKRDKSHRTKQLVMESGVLPKVVELLQRDDDCKLQLAAMNVLAKIAFGSSEQVKSIVRLGVVPPLVSLLGSSHRYIPGNAALTLANISGESPCHQDLVLQSGAILPLLKLLENHQASDIESVRMYVLVFTNLCYSKFLDCKTVNKSLQVLNKLLYHTDDEVLDNVCWALNTFSDAGGMVMHKQSTIDVLEEDGICRLIELLEHPNEDVKWPALRLLGLLSSKKSLVPIMIGNNVLPCLLTLISSTHKFILWDVCTVISNLTAGTEDHIQEMIDNGIIPQLIPLMKDKQLLLQQLVDHEIKTEEKTPLTEAVTSARIYAACAFANVINGGSMKQVKYIVDQGCIAPMLDLLSVMKDDANVITVLKGLENVSRE